MTETGIRSGPAPNDIPPALLETMSRQTLHPDLLAELVELSRRRLGWFTRHALRCIEFPWLVHRIRNAGPRVLDVGAGVSPVPLYLAERLGKVVTTVDYSASTAKPEALFGRNEWGYLDYAALDPGMTSFNMDIGELEVDEKFDAIYSISVIEHMPAETRRRMARNFDRLGAATCDVLLTLDLYGVSMNLWNFDRGQEVEPVAAHGTLQDLVAEIQAFGFELRHTEILRRAPADHPGDLAMLHFSRRS